MRSFTALVALSTALVFAGCSKHECADSAPAPQEQGTAKIPGVFVYVLDGGVAVPNYQFTVHCGPSVASNGAGRVLFTSGGCASISQVAGGNFCFDRNTYYFLKPPGNSTSRMFLRFKFDSTFDPSTLTSALVRFEPSTYTWSVPNGLPGFEWAVWDTRKALPACQGGGGGIVRQ